MLTPEEIFEKEFKRSFHGYNADEVNEFLDLVIQDFARLIEENRTLRRELQHRGGGSGATMAGTMSGTMASQQTIVRPQPTPRPRADEDLIRPSEPVRRSQPAPTPVPRDLPSIRDLIDERPAAEDSERELLRRLEALEKYIYNRDNR